jgi:hypothetical protein
MFSTCVAVHSPKHCVWYGLNRARVVLCSLALSHETHLAQITVAQEMFTDHELSTGISDAVDRLTANVNKYRFNLFVLRSEQDFFVTIFSSC